MCVIVSDLCRFFFLIIIFGTWIVDEIHNRLWNDLVRSGLQRIYSLYREITVVHPPVTPDVLERSTFKNRKKKAERNGKMQMGWGGNVHFVKHFVLERSISNSLSFSSTRGIGTRTKNWQVRIEYSKISTRRRRRRRRGKIKYSF